ncbi:MAG TPA: AI-2E family transporter [Patescibacteria group bacterium]|jgi:predicted PurR-regulated permease PerM|nr:AI-2E family transporter [Patescibacteria group bacterium]
MNFELDYSTKVILRVVAVLLALAFLWVVRDIVVVILLSLVIASALEPMVDYLNRHKIPRSVSVLGVYAIVIALLVGLASLVAPLISDQFHLLSANLPQYSADFQARYPSLAAFFGGADLSSIIHSLFSGGAGSDTLFTRTVGFFNGLFAVISVVVLSFYLVAADRGMKHFIHDLVPTAHQKVVMSLIEKIQHKMGLWVVGQFILSIFIFTLTYIGLSILGVKYALFLALIAGLLEIVPYVGPFLSAIPAIFFALIQSPALVVGVIILYIVIQKTEGYVLVPKVMEKTVGTSPLVVLLALLVGFKLAGVLGLLLAVPLAGAITVVIAEFFQEKHVSADAQPDV